MNASKKPRQSPPMHNKRMAFNLLSCFRSSIGFTNFRINPDLTIQSYGYIYSTIIPDTSFFTRQRRPITEMFVNQEEARDRFEFIYNVPAEMKKAEAEFSDNKWETVFSSKNPKQNSFDSWVAAPENTWEVSGSEIRTNALVHEYDAHFYSTDELIDPGQDFKISYTAKAETDPVDLSCVVGRSPYVQEGICEPSLIDKEGYSFVFGGFDNFLSCIQRKCYSVDSTLNYDANIEQGKEYHVVATRVGGHLTLEINGHMVSELYDPLPLMGDGLGYVSLYTFSPRHIFRDVEIAVRPTCLSTDLMARVEDHREFVLESIFDSVKYLKFTYIAPDQFIMQNVTKSVKEQVAVKEALWETERRLHQAEKLEAVGQLAGGVAHNFNNSLAVIQGYTELLKRERPDDPEVIFSTDSVIEECDKVAKLIKQLLNFSRQDEGDRTVLDVHEILENVLHIARDTFERFIDIKSSLRASHALIKGNVSQLRHVFLNLILNARDAMPGGGRLVVSTMNAELDASFKCVGSSQIQPGKYVKITVSDTGVGIDPEDLKDIFNPFFTTKPAGEGTGLGLSTVFGTLKSHGGCVDVQSRPEIGTRFHIYLPLTEERGETDKKEDIPSAAVSDETTGGTVLVVDDEAQVRNIVTAALEGNGYKVFSVANGPEAVSFYKERRNEVDLVILDLRMPDMDGEQCLTAMLEINPEIKCIVCTGYGSQSEIRAMQKKGVSAVVMKPFTFDEITRVVAENIQISSESDE